MCVQLCRPFSDVTVNHSRHYGKLNEFLSLIFTRNEKIRHPPSFIHRPTLPSTGRIFDPIFLFRFIRDGSGNDGAIKNRFRNLFFFFGGERTKYRLSSIVEKERERIRRSIDKHNMIDRAVHLHLSIRVGSTGRSVSQPEPAEYKFGKFAATATINGS